MKEPLFDVFSGASEKDAVWLESVEGLSDTRRRMERLAANVPGAYFLYSPLSHSILAKIDTRKRLQFVQQDKKAGPPRIRSEWSRMRRFVCDFIWVPAC
jgi:hypothetical protein